MSPDTIREGELELAAAGARDWRRRTDAELERQIAALERWRAEALGVIHDWRAVEVKVPGWFRAARLGQPWPHIVAEWIDHLRALVNPEALAGEGS